MVKSCGETGFERFHSDIGAGGEGSQLHPSQLSTFGSVKTSALRLEEVAEAFLDTAFDLPSQLYMHFSNTTRNNFSFS